MPTPRPRSPARTVVLLLISTVVPTLGLFMGGIEIAYGNYRFGALLILLGIVWSLAVFTLRQQGAFQ